MAQSTHGRATDKISNLKAKASDQFSKAADQAENMANRVAEQGRDASERTQEMAGNFKGALDKSIKDQSDGDPRGSGDRRVRTRRDLEITSRS
jgi:hypothetical protein